LHVLCEKPLANAVAECEAIIRSAGKAGCIIAVGHNYRFYPVRRLMPDLVKRHGLGKILRVTATEGKPYSWPTFTGYTVRREMSPGGVLINAGIHTLDSLLWWFGDPVNIRYEDDSVGGLESNVRLWMQFPDNVEVYFRQSRTCNLPYRICIEAENGSERNHTCVNPAVNHRTCWNEQLKDFTESIVQNRKPFVTGEEGIRVIRLIETCYALKRSRPLPSKAPIPGLTW
jgi:predicted dehydrogenase